MDFNILKNSGIPVCSVLDIGAHAGYFTRECRNTFPDAYYFMIDGNPISEQYIKSIGDYKICYLSNIARDTVVYKTKTNAFNTGDSLYRENTEYYSDNNLITENITTMTLDEIFKGDRYFDFIKIDCQGSELDIIKGGLETCSKAQVFLLEASVYPYNIGAPMFDELREFLLSIGFLYNKIVTDIKHPTNQDLLIQHDVLFTKAELL